MSKTNRILVQIALVSHLAALLLATPALAQEDNSLSLRLSRDFGYSSGSGQIQGTFSMHVTGPANLARVDFFIDGKQIGEAAKAPFSLQFSTGSYPLGIHKISAVGYTSDGKELHSSEVTAEFVSADQGLKSTGKIAIPILVFSGLAVLLSALFPVLTGRGKRSQLPLGESRNYGIKGGGICTRCGRPFSFNVLAPNLVIYKFDRCPYCGKWSLVRIASLTELRKAEAAELEAAQASKAVPEESEEEKLRKELDDSRYQEF
jgi:DNA-directed RNA polymerase subunit RPC12/RpoP